MENLLTSKLLPPGFRFHPSDEELLMHYLKRKVLGKSLNPKMISDLDVYRYDPWDLPSKSYLKTKDLKWFFFSPRGKKPANGPKTNRSTEHGYWKSTGYDRTIKYNKRPVGKIKTLIFHLGKPPSGGRTDWVMHEYRLEDNALAEKGISQDSFVLCKIFKKSGLGPKNGEHHLAPFVEEEWESDDDENAGMICRLVPYAVADGCVAVAVNNPSSLVITNTLHSSDIAESNEPVIIDACVETEEDELDSLLAMFTDAHPDGINVVCDDDIFAGLGDIAVPNGFNSLQGGVHWSECFAQNSDGFMELNDLM